MFSNCFVLEASPSRLPNAGAAAIASWFGFTPETFFEVKLEHDWVQSMIHQKVNKLETKGGRNFTTPRL